MSPLMQFREFYARFVTASAEVRDERIRRAFADVPREQFLPPGPWKVLASGGYIETPADGPALLYQDIVVAIDPIRRINNGEPSLHARCLNAVSPQAGESVLHIGCGSGYYTALLAQLVGPSGHVTGIEVVPEIAEMAIRNLDQYAHVSIECRSGSAAPLPTSDVIYVNAGATEPLKVWLDALRPGGRLIFPLTPGWDYGGMLLVMRGDDDCVFDAQFVSQAGFIPCVGAQDATTLPRLKAAFQRPDWLNVRSLHVKDGEPDSSCWLAGETWWLSTATVH
ncbi:MAG: methyltransferase domain-containing protein [Rhizobiales bacterium]|nr:methyltransferase domain-containing protein [Hyphomicrobiales bacterium]